MSGPDTGLADLFVTGARFGAAPAALRDRLFYEDAEAAAETAALRAAGLADAVAVSTCDRVEIWGAGDPAPARAALLSRAGGGESEKAAAADALVLKRGRAALEHIFRVAGSLDSMVIGEPQVLGQIKACHRLARSAGAGGAAGPLDAVLDAAYACAGRIRTETRIGEGPVSIAGAARAAARGVHGPLSGVEALMLGGGGIGAVLAEQLMKDGVKSLTVLHARPRRAEALAAQLGCAAAPAESLGRLIARADILIAAESGAAAPAVTADLVNAALKHRRRRPVFILDFAFPGGAEPAVARIEDAYLYDLADLERAAAQTMAQRAREAGRARGIVSESAAAFERARAARAAAPAVARLRELFEAERRRALAEGGDAEAVSRRLVSRLLHGPSAALKAMAAEDGPGAQAAERLLARLFEKDARPDDF